MSSVIVLTYNLEEKDIIGVFEDFDAAEKRIYEDMKTYGLTPNYYNYYKKEEWKIESN